MSDRRFGTIIEIGDVLVSEDVIEEFFCCDYEVCRGKCCIIGDSGAPLEEEELEELERHYEEYKGLMSQAGRDAIDQKGFFEVDIEDDLVTPVVPQTQECAYTHFDADGNCLCAIERCFFQGHCSWRKPISCSLYPIRVTKLTGGGLALNLHRWDICKDAFEKGRKEKVRVYQFLREPIERRFGPEFWTALDAAAKHILGE